MTNKTTRFRCIEIFVGVKYSSDLCTLFDDEMQYICTSKLKVDCAT